MSIKDLSSDKVIFLSLIGNSSEVTLQHPLNVLKNYKQSSLTNSYKFDYSFKNLYRGYIFNFYNVNTVSLIQYYSYHFLYKYTKNDFFSSLSSGLVGGLLASPSEFYIINKNMNESLLQNIKKNKLKKIYKFGLKNCLIREGIYTSCLFTLTPRLENFINKDFSYGNIISPIISGLTATFLSHPFDTIKTNQQKNYNMIKDNQISLKNSYKGFGYRSFRITTTFFILNETNKFFIKNYF